MCLYTPCLIPPDYLRCHHCHMQITAFPLLLNLACLAYYDHQFILANAWHLLTCVFILFIA
ncbi:hypothetical protein GGR55DRAFT_633872 [Xylaria sp. FL0064]|nr:hypothetical protein GGR55DRAFT_633872 [Xylaria sp. FL0064]